MATMAISNNINELDILLQVCILSCTSDSTGSSRNAISQSSFVPLSNLLSLDLISLNSLSTAQLCKFSLNSVNFSLSPLGSQ